MRTTTLKWKDQHTTTLASHRDLHKNAAYCDMVLKCADVCFHLHQSVLSACSDFFADILRDHPPHIEPLVVVTDVKEAYIRAIVSYIYCGVVEIDAISAPEFLEVCAYFKIKGLSDHQIRARREELVEDIVVLEETAPERTSQIDQSFQRIELYLAGENDPAKAVVPQYPESYLLQTEELPPKSAINSLSNYDDADESAAQIDEEVPNDEDDQSQSEANITGDDSSPKSTKSDRSISKQRASRKSSVERSQSTNMDLLVNLVCSGDMSLSQCSKVHNIPKSVLWRRLQKRSDYQPRRLKKGRESAQLALLNGEKLSNVSRKYNVPISTMYRDKNSLLREGKLEKKNTQRVRGDTYKQAIIECQQGLSQSEAARKYGIPKSTLWRKMKEHTHAA